MNQSNYIIETENIPQQMSLHHGAEYIIEDFRNFMTFLILNRTNSQLYKGSDTYKRFSKLRNGLMNAISVYSLLTCLGSWATGIY